MKPRFTVVTASLVGAVLIHLVLTACSSMKLPTSLSSLDASTDARAQTATDCTQWQVQSFAPTALTSSNATIGTGMVGVDTFAAFTLPSGWEPIGGGILENGVVARNCIAH
jgi:hypothetical protein